MVEAREERPVPLPCPIRARARLEGRLRELAADEARSGGLEIALRRPADELLSRAQTCCRERLAPRSAER